ncbi:MAG: STAS domain-containing protein [Acidimicrobiia bacterium]|nr:STAS domain-containing protein [Acidimicrobiia bacterium]
MPGERFEATVDMADGHGAVRMKGDLTGAARETVEAAYARAEAPVIVLDFTEVGYINSTGIAIVVGVLARARADGRQVRAFGLDEHYRKIFQITRIADFMAIFDDEMAAVAS